MYVPRFGETNIVYDVIDNKNNNILTTTTDKTYGTITIQDGILSHSDNESNFNSPTGIIYGSDTGGKWSLASTDITNGILTKSNDLTFDSHTGLLYGKSTGKQTWSLDSVVIDKGILTKSNDILGFNSLTGILYGSATGDTWSLESTKITDGIFTRSNNTLVFNNLNGLLYGSIKDDVWSLNNVNDPTPYEDDEDYVLYYGKDANNANKVTPHWRLLRINGKNFITDNTVIHNQWNNIVVDPTTCNIISIQTERLEQQDYGLYNYNGKVVKLSPKVLNDIGFKIFPSSEINETGYVTTNVIIYNSSITDVTLPVNYYNVINFHSNEQNNPNSNMYNKEYTKGFYNYITVSNSLPIYDQVKNTYTGFYNFINSNIYKNDTNDTNTNNNYLHFTTTLNVDSIYMPKPDPNVKYFTSVNDKEQLYDFNIISNYKCILSISTNFSKIQTNTFYQNMFFCNPTTPVLSNENTDVLLGYLIVDLSTIDKSTGKVNINQLIDIDSTIPYNTNISNLTVEELKNGLLTFKPQYYISNNNSIISLYYDDNTDGIFTNISAISTDNMILNNNHLLRDTDYTYNNKYLRLYNISVNSYTNALYQIGTIVIPTYGIESTDNNGNIIVNLKYLYCDTSTNKDVYNIDNCLQPYTYITTIIDNKNNLLTNPVLGYTSTATDLCRVYLNTALPFSQPSILLNSAFYTTDGTTIINKITNQEIKIFSNVGVDNTDKVITIYDDIVVNFYINEFNNLVYKDNSNISFLHDTYIFNQYIQIDNSILYINSETSNIHTLVMSNNTMITSFQMKLSTGGDSIPVTVYFSNNVYTSQGKCNNETFNKKLYTTVSDEIQYYIYETRPIIYNKNYIFHNDLIVKYYNDALINTPEGIIYNNHYIFSKHDIHINALGQIAVNTDKYYYNSNESAIYSIYNDSKYVLSSGDDINIDYRQYIELTDKNFFTSSFINDEDENVFYLLCKTLIPLSSFSAIYHTYPKYNNTIQLITNPYYGVNNYGNNIMISNNILHGKNVLINKLPFILNSDVQYVDRTDTSIQVWLNTNGIVILTYQGLSKNNTYITDLNTTDGIIYSNDYIDIPLFDTPIEKDIKVVLKPISKYSILSYNNVSYTDQIYTLAKNVGFKISLCNIYVTLTSYIGEYPSMIN